MISRIGKICQAFCPCLFRKKTLSQYEKTLAGTEHQSFVGQKIESTAASQTQQFQAIPNIYSQQSTPYINQKMHNKDLEKKNEAKQQIAQASYLDCINQAHPYYELLSEKISQLPSIFDLDVEPENKVPDTPYGLKVYVKPSEDDKINIFVYTFVFPTTYQFYEQLQNNFALQKSLDSNIDAYECRDIIDENTKIIYLAYKKILIISPRDFVYVRYTFKKGQQFWSVAASLPNQEPIFGKTRGSIIMTATRAFEKDDQLYMSVYSQVDMKMGIKSAGTKQRGITEIKKYLDKCYANIQEQKNSII